MTRDINLLKQMSFSNEINLIYKSKIARKEKHLMFLKQNLEYKRIEEQLESPLLKQRIVNFENKKKMKFVQIYLMLFGIENNILLAYLMSQILMKEIYPQKLGLFK